MANYDIALFKGHGNYGGNFDPGACSQGYREQDIVSSIVDKATKLLTNAGIRVLTGEHNYQNNLLNGHTLTAKCAYSVHCNAGGGSRTELFVPKGEKYFATEHAIGQGMVNLGIPTYQIKSRDYDSEAFVNRTDGVPLGGTDWYKEIREAWKKGISLTIFETGFIDSTDINVLANKQSEIALLLATELAKLCDKTITPEAPKPVTNDSDGFYRVVVGSYKDKNNAISQQEKLKKAGFDSFLDFYKK